MAETAASPTADEKGAQKPKGGLSIVQLALVVVLGLLSSASGGVISGYIISRNLPKAEAAHAEEGSEKNMAEIIEKGGALPLDPFVVNLADKDSPRYLRIKISLLVDNKEKIGELTENQALILKIRDVILQMLTTKSSGDLVHEEGKTKLRADIVEKLQEFFAEPKLIDVMFTEFVIQL